MRQKISPYRNINNEGTTYGPALILNNREKDFLDEVEEGIKPLVKACIDVGIDTFSSCEGHVFPGGSLCRYISIAIDAKKKDEWIRYIKKLNYRNNLKINVNCLELREIEYFVLNRDYECPIKFYMDFFDPSDYERTTNILVQSILSREFPEVI